MGKFVVASGVATKVSGGPLTIVDSVVCSACSTRLGLGERCDHMLFGLMDGCGYVYQDSGQSLVIEREERDRD